MNGSKSRVTKHSWHSAQTWPSAWISAKAHLQGLCSLTQCLHLLQRVISTNGHRHSCVLPAPACPPVSLSLISPDPSPHPFLEQLCIIPCPLTSPFPNTPTCPFWFCASSWSVHSAKSNRCGWHWPARVSRLCPGLTLTGALPELIEGWARSVYRSGQMPLTLCVPSSPCRYSLYFSPFSTYFPSLLLFCVVLF